VATSITRFGYGERIGADPLESPPDALRRLKLPGPAGRNYDDVLDLDATDLRVVVRRLDSERETVQASYESSSRATTALKSVEELLARVNTLYSANASAGTSTRRENQRELDGILDDVQKAISDADSTNDALFDGTTELPGGRESLKIDRVSLDTLGQVFTRGRKFSLEDLARGGRLDLSRRGSRTARTGGRVIDQAIEDVKLLREKLEAFQVEKLRPRLGDVATALEGLYEDRSGGLTTTESALATARDIRTTLLTSATLALTVGAEGWDSDRLVALVS